MHVSAIAVTSRPRWLLCHGVISKTSLNDPPGRNYLLIVSQQRKIESNTVFVLPDALYAICPFHSTLLFVSSTYPLGVAAIIILDCAHSSFLITGKRLCTHRRLLGKRVGNAYRKLRLPWAEQQGIGGKQSVPCWRER